MEETKKVLNKFSNIIKKLHVSTNKKAIIICGIPGAGKTTLRNKLIRQKKLTNYFVNDPDLFLPFFNNDYDKTAEITKKIIEPYIISKGYNIIYDKTCSYIKDTEKLINLLKKNNYYIEFHILFTDINVAIERVNKRERKIPIDIIIHKNKEITDNKNKYLELKADEIHLYNNNDFFVIYKSS